MTDQLKTEEKDSESAGKRKKGKNNKRSRFYCSSSYTFYRQPVPRTIFVYNSEEILTNFQDFQVKGLPSLDFSDIIVIEQVSETIVKAFHRKSRKYVLLKAFSWDSSKISNEQLILEHFLCEKLRSSSIPSNFNYLGLFKTEKKTLYLLLESGVFSLEEILKCGKTFTEPEILAFLSGVVDFMAGLQELGISNRQITLQNIGFSEDYQGFRLLDFGFSGLLPESQDSMESSMAFPIRDKELMAPELEDGREKPRINPYKCDVFSLGMIAMKIIDYFIEKKELLAGKIEDPKVFAQFPSARPFILSALERDPGKRPDFIELRKRFKDSNIPETRCFPDMRKYIEICYLKKLRKKSVIFSGLKALCQEHKELFLKYRSESDAKSRFHLEKAWRLYQDLTVERKNRKDYCIDEFLPVDSPLMRCSKRAENDDETLFFYCELAGLYLKEENLPKALEMLENARKEEEKLIGNAQKPGKQSENLAVFYMLMGKYHQMRGEWAKSEDFYKKSLELCIESDKKTEIIDVLAVFYHEKRDFRSEKRHIKESLTLKKRVFGKKSREIALAYENLGVFYAFIGRFPKSKVYLAKSLKLLLNVSGEIEKNTARLYERVGFLNEKLNNGAVALEFYRKSLEINEKLAENDGLLIVYNRLAWFHLTNPSNAGKSEDFMRKCRRILKRKSDNSRKKAESYLEIARICLFHGDSKSDKYLKRAISCFSEIPSGENHGFYAEYYSLMGDYCDIIEKNKGKAEIYYVKASDIHPNNPEKLLNLGSFYEKACNHPKAEEFYLKSLQTAQDQYPKPSIFSANAANVLGLFYESLGDLAKSEDFYHISLRTRLTLYGESHMDILASYDNLATLYEQRGDLKSAEDYYKKSLKTSKDLFGNSQVQTAECYNNLGVFYCKGNDLEKAEKAYLKSLEIRRAALGERDLETIRTLSNLGTLYDKLGDFKRAKDYLSECLAALGEENTEDFANCLSNIARVHVNMGELEEAERAFLRCLEIFSRVLGGENEGFANTAHCLAGVYESIGELGKAEEYLTKSVGVIEGLFGRAHAKTAEAYFSLGIFYENLGNLPLAKDFYQKALDSGALKIEETTGTLNKLGFISYRLGEWQLSEGFYQQTLGCLDKGEDSPEERAICYNNLGLLYKSLDLLTQSEEAYLKAISISEGLFGQESGNTATSYNNLGGVYMKMGELNKAEEFYLRSLRIREQLFGEGDVITASSYNNLGALYHRRGMREKAEYYGFRAYELYAKVYGEEDENTRVILANARSYSSGK